MRSGFAHRSIAFFPRLAFPINTAVAGRLWCWPSGWWWRRDCGRRSYRTPHRGRPGPKEADLKPCRGRRAGGALALILAAVFVPTCYAGITGALYKQFALTVGDNRYAFRLVTLYSLSPALAAMLLNRGNTTSRTGCCGNSMAGSTRACGAATATCSRGRAIRRSIGR